MPVTFLTNEDKTIIDQSIAQLSEEIAELKENGGPAGDGEENVVKSVNGFTPDGSGAVVIEYDNETSDAYRHEGLGEGHKVITVKQNERYTNSPHVFLGKNYWPVLNLTKKIGDTTVTIDGHELTCSGTRAAQLSWSIPYDKTTEYWPVPEDIKAGEKLSIHVFGAAGAESVFPNVKLEMFDSDKKFLSQIYAKIDAGNNYAALLNRNVPNGVVYVRYSLTIDKDIPYNNTFFPVITKANVEVLNDVSFENSEAVFETDNVTRDVCTAPYKSSIFCKFDLKHYINMQASKERDDGEEINNILTPEMFGAFGDNTHDDTAALQAAINAAISEGKELIGGGWYKTTSELKIVGENLNVNIRRISYSGTECAVSIAGRYNIVKFNSIYALEGVAVRLNGGADGANCEYNDITIERAISAFNTVEYIVVAYNVIYNRLTFGNFTSGDGYACVYYSPFQMQLEHFPNAGSNTFIGGCFTGGEWGAKNVRAQDTFMTCAFEGVDKGIHCNSGGVIRIVSPRYVELTKYNSDEDRGVFFETSDLPYDVIPQGEKYTELNFMYLEAPSGLLYVKSINIKTLPTSGFNNGSVKPLSKTGYPGVAEIRAPLHISEGTRVACSFLFFANHILIREPFMSRTLTLDTSSVGYVGDYWDTGDQEAEFIIYDTFVVGESGAVYTLPPSYDLVAFNKFKVIQQDGKYCTLKDWRGTIVFNGEAYGNGVFDVKIVRDDTFSNADYDNNGQIWEIRRMSDYSLVDTMPHASE